MKKAVLLTSLLILSAFAMGVPAAVPSAEIAPAVAELAAPAAAAFQTSASMIPFPGPNFCGDPCSPEGAMIGCIDTSGPVARRRICTCSGGHLIC